MTREPGSPRPSNLELLVAKVNTTVFTIKGGWTLGPVEGHGGRAATATECEVRLEIQGTRKAGYNLAMSPDGFFTADHWFKTKAQALESAEELFGLIESDWTEKSAC